MPHLFVFPHQHVCVCVCVCVCVSELRTFHSYGQCSVAAAQIYVVRVYIFAGVFNERYASKMAITFLRGKFEIFYSHDGLWPIREK